MWCVRQKADPPQIQLAINQQSPSARHNVYRVLAGDIEIEARDWRGRSSMATP